MDSASPRAQLHLQRILQQSGDVNATPNRYNSASMRSSAGPRKTPVYNTNKAFGNSVSPSISIPRSNASRRSSSILSINNNNANNKDGTDSPMPVDRLNSNKSNKTFLDEEEEKTQVSAENNVLDSRNAMNAQDISEERSGRVLGESPSHSRSNTPSKRSRSTSFSKLQTPAEEEEDQYREVDGHDEEANRYNEEESNDNNNDEAENYREMEDSEAASHKDDGVDRYNNEEQFNEEASGHHDDDGADNFRELDDNEDASASHNNDNDAADRYNEEESNNNEEADHNEEGADKFRELSDNEDGTHHNDVDRYNEQSNEDEEANRYEDASASHHDDAADRYNEEESNNNEEADNFRELDDNEDAAHNNNEEEEDSVHYNDEAARYGEEPSNEDDDRYNEEQSNDNENADHDNEEADKFREIDDNEGSSANHKDEADRYGEDASASHNNDDADQSRELDDQQDAKHNEDASAPHNNDDDADQSRELNDNEDADHNDDEDTSAHHNDEADRYNEEQSNDDANHNEDASVHSNTNDADNFHEIDDNANADANDEADKYREMDDKEEAQSAREASANRYDDVESNEDQHDLLPTEEGDVKDSEEEELLTHEAASHEPLEQTEDRFLAEDTHADPVDSLYKAIAKAHSAMQVPADKALEDPSLLTADNTEENVPRTAEEAEKLVEAMPAAALRNYAKARDTAVVTDTEQEEEVNYWKGKAEELQHVIEEKEVQRARLIEEAQSARQALEDAKHTQRSPDVLSIDHDEETPIAPTLTLDNIEREEANNRRRTVADEEEDFFTLIESADHSLQRALRQAPLLADTADLAHYPLGMSEEAVLVNMELEKELLLLRRELVRANARVDELSYNNHELRKALDGTGPRQNKGITLSSIASLLQ
ncbi:hypothetical protein ADEAN_000983800 [Angomonas deanei]|uniref:Uncharacterized protein n=1 Tax=Angomonas deanei TaxID=59799 RepID=A0A7G2CR57_9TRYP|nr:hypothetical protein ADEAN_000983800 [Angomonas deanei]